MVSESDAFEQGFYGIPSSKDRAKLSPEKLAIELAKLEKGSPLYILIEHELNLRISKSQSTATYVAAIFGLIGVVLGALLQNSLQQPFLPDPCICIYPEQKISVQKPASNEVIKNVPVTKLP